MANRWIANYVIDDGQGGARMLTMKIVAASLEEAKIVAARNAPAKDFVLTLKPESDEQFLGQVKSSALSMKPENGKPRNYQED